MDWSWLEEVEYLRAAESLAAAGERGEQGGRVSATPTNGSAGRRRACEHREAATGRSVAMSVTATAKSLASGGSRWPPSGGALLRDRQNGNNNNRRSGGRHRRHRNDNDTNNDGDDDDDEAARCNATNEAVDRENRDGATATATMTAAANSWMRASMRRLRHLRLPEGTTQRATGNEPTNRRAVVSAPNSLPDIALIAPEILAAQTNGSGTSGTLLRPSSAPARNANTGAATSRRAGRQFAGGRSRGARNREVSSRQGSLGSTTTASDTTVSGNTTCSSSFGAASSSAPSSTATSPQRAAPRRSVNAFP